MKLKIYCLSNGAIIKKYRLTHIVCLNALSIAGNTIISENYNFSSNQLNNTEISKSLTNITNIDWSNEEV